jgi:hypothetical protein
MASRSRWWIEVLTLVAATLATTACGKPTPAPFSREETEQALAPAHDLWQRCYAGTAFERSRRSVTVEYRLNVDAGGNVRSVPTFVSPEDPTLVECVRHRLDDLHFPARAKDHIELHFELGPAGPVSVAAHAGSRLGTCEPPCAAGFSCHYEAAAAPGVCRVMPGRCRFERDCAPSQACQRLSEPLGVCAERNP